MNLLEVKNISKTYGTGEATVHALKQATFSVPKGEFVAIVGESGSGKSTLLNMIGALDTPTSGKVFIDGKDIFSMKERNLTVFRRRNIGFIFQSFNLIPELTVEQNIIFPVLLDYQKPNKKYLEELLTVLGLKERRNHCLLYTSISQSEKIEQWLCDVTQKLIEQGATTFYLGGYGAFDSLAASVLRSQKKRYPQIELILVLAYLNTGRDTSGYDSTVYPPLETVPRRFAISHRNRWMVESADVVIAYVLHDWGGAATTLRCAKQKKKQIISYRDEMGS